MKIPPPKPFPGLHFPSSPSSYLPMFQKTSDMPPQCQFVFSAGVKNAITPSRLTQNSNMSDSTFHQVQKVAYSFISFPISLFPSTGNPLRAQPGPRQLHGLGRDSVSSTFCIFSCSAIGHPQLSELRILLIAYALPSASYPCPLYNRASGPVKHELCVRICICFNVVMMCMLSPVCVIELG